MNRDWQSGVGKFAIAIALGGVTVLCWESMLWAQIIPDKTLGAESSVVTPDNIKGLESDRISGGAVRGSNLFHSFREFNIAEGRGGYFENPAVIENIFSRVTGGNPSNMLGTLGVLGNANLFFLNPNGILFGPNASLDLRGSFLGTTADSILFPDGKHFSGTNPGPPPLLTVNVRQPIGLEFQGSERTIYHQGNLAVDSGQNLALVGGNLIIDGGSLIASGGRVELGGLAEGGTVSFKENSSLSFPEDIAKTDITLSNAAGVDVRGTGGGSITINARNLNLEAGDSGKSLILAGITADSTSADAQAGNITIKATENITVDNSTIGNSVFPEAVGNAGGVTITTGSLNLTDGGQVSASTFSQGNAGSVQITARDNITIDGEGDTLTIDGEVLGDFPSAATSLVFPEAVGNAGGVTITTVSLNLTDGGLVSAGTFGQGNAGLVQITASDSITIDGEGDILTIDGEVVGIGIPSGVTSGVFSGAEGDAGGVTITTASLTLNNGGIVSTSTFGQGNAGSVLIIARDTITMDGEDSNGFPSSARSSVGLDAVLDTDVEGDAGGVTITTGFLTLTNGGTVSASTFGQGDAGSVQITARDSITFDGETSGGFPSGATSSVNPGAVGDAGGVIITTGSMSLTNEGRVNASTLGQGKAGTLTVTANTLEASSGGQLQTSTSGNFDAGKINLKVEDSINLAGEGSGIFSNTESGSNGKGGSIIIDPNTVIIRDGAQIAVNSDGSGVGGNIDLQAGSLTLERGAITAETASNQGGNINLTISDLLTLRNNSQITATAGTDEAGTDEAGGDGGNITIDAPFIIAFPQENSDITANAFEGNGGNITINTNGIFGIEFRDRETPLSDITASSEFGRQGAVEINSSGVNPTRGLNNLPQEAVEAEVAQSCQETSSQSTLEFFDIGRGGLPPTPEDLFSSETVIAEWIPLDLVEEKISVPTSEQNFSENGIKNITLQTTFLCQKKLIKG